MLVCDEEIVPVQRGDGVGRVNEGVGDGPEMSRCARGEVEPELLDPGRALAKKVRYQESGRGFMELEADGAKLTREADEVETGEGLVVG